MHECLANTRTSSTEGSIILHWVWLCNSFLLFLLLLLLLCSCSCFEKVYDTRTGFCLRV